METFWQFLGCRGVLLGVSWWPSGVPWGAVGVSRVPLGAPRWLSGSLVCGSWGALLSCGASLGGSLVSRGLARSPAAQKETALPVLCTHRFARQVQYFRGVDLNKGTLVPEGSLGAIWGSFGSLLGCLWVLWGVPCWPSGVPWGALGVFSVPLGAPGCPSGGSRVAFGLLCCRLGRLLVALWCLEGSPEAQQYKKKPRFPFYVLTGSSRRLFCSAGTVLSRGRPK